MRSGRRIAFDVGKARIGVAVCDFHAILCSPIAHIKRTSDEQALREMVAVIDIQEVIEIYVGLPVNMQQNHTESTRDAIALAKALAAQVSIPVRMLDERLSTNAASAALRSAGKSAKQQRSFIDSAAAAVILEQALETERSQDRAPGLAVEEIDEA